MTRRPALALACAHMTDERLYAHQLAALESAYDCSVFVFREHDSMAGMAACVPGAELQVIESCGHLSTIEQPEAVTSALTRWLRATD